MRHRLGSSSADAILGCRWLGSGQRTLPQGCAGWKQRGERACTKFPTQKDEWLVFNIIRPNDPQVGKTALVLRFVNDVWHEGDYASTIGGSYLAKKVVVDDTPFTFQIWDTVSVNFPISIHIQPSLRSLSISLPSFPSTHPSLHPSFYHTLLISSFFCIQPFPASTNQYSPTHSTLFPPTHLPAC